MKRILLALAMIAAMASPSEAALKYRWAVVWDAYAEDIGGGFNRFRDRGPHLVRAIEESGITVDFISPLDTLAYGQPGMSDKAWFASRYDVLIIPAAGALSSTATNRANRIHLGFRPALDRTLMSVAVNAPESPYSGTWDIPVIVSSGDAVNLPAINFVNGQSGFISGAPPLGAKIQKRTAACPGAIDGTGDTLFVSTRMAVRDTTILSQVIPLLASANGRTWKMATYAPARADTMAYWKYLPDPTKPGVYWSTIREYNPTGVNDPNVHSYMDAFIAGQACLITGTRPPRPFVGWIDVDHVHPMKGTLNGEGRAEVYNVRDMRAFGDSLRNWNMVMSGPIMCGAQVGAATLKTNLSGTGFIQSGVKKLIRDYQDRYSFHVHDHFDVNTSTWRTSLIDTSVGAAAYNAAITSARSTAFNNLTRISSAGSFGFAETLPQDDGDYRALKVFGDAGVKAVRGIGGWYTAVSATDTRAGKVFVDAFTYPMPWKSSGTDSKVVWVTGGLTTISSSVRMWNDHAGNSYSAMMATDYPTTVEGWYNSAFSIWLVRGSAYFHGSENMQGTSNSVTGGNEAAWAPTIIMMKHLRNMLKLTAPFVSPLNETTASNRLGGRSAL
jgi:hypothetical protein